MSAQGPYNWPNGVRQIAYRSFGSTDPFEVEFEDPETTDSYLHEGITPSSFVARVLTFDARYTKITVTRGALSEVFNLAFDNRVAILVLSTLGETPFINIYESEPEWVAGHLVINTLNEDVRYGRGEQEPGNVFGIVESESANLFANPLAMTLPDRSDISHWYLGDENETLLVSIATLSGDPPTWNTVASEFVNTENSKLDLILVYRSGENDFLANIDFTLRSDDFAQFKWQYFAPALA